MTAPDITVYGAYWCPDCRRSKQFLGEHQIPYRWVDIEQREPGMLETGTPGIFAAGDVRAGSTKQVSSAAGEGATVALLVREYLKTA